MLKEKFLELLDKDKEFRYAVMGYLGIAEVIKRLDNMQQELVKLRQESAKLLQKLTELRADFNEMRKEMAELREEQVKLRADFNEMRKEQIEMREDFNRMLSIISKMQERLGRVERTLEKLTLDIEGEAREVLEYRLRKMGLDVKLGRIETPSLELDIYGVSGDFCIIGEATVRLGPERVRELARKVERLASTRPDLLRPKRIVVIYTALAIGNAVAEAEKLNIWVLKATGDLTKPPKLG